jgi:AraC-like DNA-binding protein
LYRWACREVGERLFRLASASTAAPNGSVSGGGPGYALTVVRALAADPADPSSLDEWAARLQISPTTLQRDFQRQFGLPYSRWRTRLRLRAAHVLLLSHPVTTVAHQVGYASPSAFVVAYAKQYGHTPGRRTTRAEDRAGRSGSRAGSPGLSIWA